MLKKFYNTFGYPCEDIFNMCVTGTGERLDCCELFVPVFNLNQGLCYSQNVSVFPRAVASGIYSVFAITLEPFKGPNTTAVVLYGNGREQASVPTDQFVLHPSPDATWMNIRPTFIESMPKGGNVCGFLLIIIFAAKTLPLQSALLAQQVTSMTLN